MYFIDVYLVCLQITKWHFVTLSLVTLSLVSCVILPTMGKHKKKMASILLEKIK